MRVIQLENSRLRTAFTFLLCTTVWVATAQPAPAQEAQDRTATRRAAAEDDPNLERQRLLTLADGQVLRARTRQADGVWEWKDGRTWLPAGEVVRYRPVDEAVAEADRLRRDVKKDDHARRADLARWMAGQGLYDEAIIELNRVFREHPEHATALRVVRESYIPLELSEHASDPAVALKETLIKGAGGTPAITEVAIQRLAEFGDRVDLRQVLQIELRVPQHKRRGFAAHSLRRLYPGTERELLITRALLDGWSGVREQAALALREGDDLSVALPALEALANKHSSVRANAAEALGNLGFEAAVEPLVGHLKHTAGLAGGGGTTGTRSNLFAGLQTAYVMDYNVELAQGASIADPIVNVQASGVVFDVRTTVQMTEVIELRRTMGALRQLTGLNFHDHPEKWVKWWEENGEQWRAVDRAQAFEAKKLAAARAADQ